MVDDPEQWAANLAYLRAAIDLAVELAGPEGTPVINNLAGGKQGEFDEPAIAAWSSGWARWCPMPSRGGLIIALEPHVFTVLESPETSREVIEAIDSPHLRIQFDISHFDVLGYSIEETVPILAPLAVHTHVKDQRGLAPDHEFLIPGDGTFDYVRYLKAMRTRPGTRASSPER